MINDARRGQWMAFLAAMLGWMFDGFEMGLFPLVAQPALKELIPGAEETTVGNWIGAMTAGFLVGAATGGVVFGWLGDRIGRVRAMSLSILVYALFSGLCGIANAPWQLFLFRFLASLGMGGEWSLGVSLVMEIWPDRSRGWLAGFIGAASNVGFMLVALLSLTFVHSISGIHDGLLAIGISAPLVERLTANGAWRLLALSASLPAVLTFFVRIFVPESEKWLEEQEKGNTKQWSSWDLMAVVFGACCAMAFVSLWAMDAIGPLQLNLPIRIVGTLIGLVLVYYGYTYPIRQYLARSAVSMSHSAVGAAPINVTRNMWVGAVISGIALLGTWASIQNAAPWAGALEDARVRASADGANNEAVKQLAPAAAAKARAFTQVASALGAVFGTIGAALLGNRMGRRACYCVLCLAAIGSALLFFQFNTQFGAHFLATVFLAGGLTASFYGWLPLYLPELFPTRVRAFGQGFAFNFGRIIAAVGSLQFGYLMKNHFNGSYPQTCTILSGIYLLGLVFIWLAPETSNKPLPD